MSNKMRKVPTEAKREVPREVPREELTADDSIQEQEEKVEKEKPAKAELSFTITSEGVQEINNFLVLVDAAVKNGIIDYRGAYNKLVNLMQTSIKPK